MKDELHRKVTDNWTTALFAALYELEHYNMQFEDLCEEAMIAESMEFGTREKYYNSIDDQRALSSQERTIHAN